MPRARNIKPGLFDNEILGEADPLLTILFASLWCLADREGRLEDRPVRIKKNTFPYRVDINITNLLCELQRMGFITRYKAGEIRVIQVIEFKKHQRPHHTERQSTLPALDSNSLILNGYDDLTVKAGLSNQGLSVVERSDSLIPDLLIPDTGYLIPDTTVTKKIGDIEFERFWQIYPKRPGANKTQALKAWNARRKEGVTAEEMQRGADRYSKFCQAMKTDPQYMNQGSTFLGPSKLYQHHWQPTGKQNANQSFADRLTGKKGDDDGFILDAE